MLVVLILAILAASAPEALAMSTPNSHLVSPAMLMPQSTPEQFLDQIREQGAKAPVKLFDQLAQLQTEEAFQALCEAIDFQESNERHNRAIQALKYFRGVPELDEEAVDYLLKEVDSKNPKTALIATVTLGGLWPASAQGLAGLALEVDNFDQRSAALMGMVDNGMRLDVKLLKRMASSKDVMVRYEGALALLQLDAGSFHTPETAAQKQKEVLKAARSKNVADRLAAVEYLRTGSVTQTYALLESKLSDKDPRVNRKCLSVLESRANSDAVGVLVRRMETADAGERWRTAEALRRLSGLSFGPTPQPWKRWWKAEKENFKPADPSIGNSGSKDTDDTGAAFYGLPIRAQHLVFAVDSSDSMKGKTGNSGRSRIDIAKEQLRNAIADLPEGSTFGIVNFGKNAKSWNGELVAAKSKVKRRALDHVDKMKLSWGTQAYEALRTAFEDPSADAIVLLTDGDPQISLIMDRNLIRRMVVQWNRTRHLQVDCITIGTERGWLRKIAVATGGRYKRVE